MKRFYALCAGLAIAAFVLNGFIAQASNQDRFWTEAAQMGMAEVALGNLALQKSQSEEVKSFAQKMVDDHTAANNELKQLAAGKNVTLPTDMSAKHRAAMDKLNGMSGMDFDKAFMKQMVKDHEAAVKLFQRESERGTDADTKAFAAKNLPVLQSHLQMARSMSDTMKSMKKDSDDKSNSNSGNMNSNSNSNSNRNTNSNSNSNSNTNSNGNSLF